MSDATLELVETGPEHIELIRNLYQFYAYESSDWEQEDVEVADLFVLKKYRRLGIGSALATQVLTSGEGDWLVRFYRQDEVAAAFWRTVLDQLPRPVQAIEVDDDPQLQNFLVTRARH